MQKAMTNHISQHKMRRYLELKAAVDEFAKLREEILSMLDDGTTQQEGRYHARIKLGNARRSVPWKDCFIDLADQHYGKGEGKKKAEEVIENTAYGARPKSVEIIDLRAAEHARS